MPFGETVWEKFMKKLFLAASILFTFSNLSLANGKFRAVESFVTQAKAGRQAFRVVSQNGQTEQCLNNLQPSTLQPRLGDIVFLELGADRSMKFTDSDLTTGAIIEYPVGSRTATQDQLNGSEATYESAYITTDTLLVNVTDSDGRAAKITIRLTAGRIDFAIGVGLPKIGSPFLFSSCSLLEIR